MINTITICKQEIQYEISTDKYNCKIINSYKINDPSVQRIFVQLILSRDQFKKRSAISYIREWQAHNILYKLHLFRAHTADTDLNINESLIRRIGYFCLTIFAKKK